MSARKSQWEFINGVEQPPVQSLRQEVSGQADLDIVRLGWARQVLDEECSYPSSHSSARIRRAQTILLSQLHSYPK